MSSQANKYCVIIQFHSPESKEAAAATTARAGQKVETVEMAYSTLRTGGTQGYRQLPRTRGRFSLSRRGKSVRGTRGGILAAAEATVV
eukprot:7390970-Prymnesium_polylepis.2